MMREDKGRTDKNKGIVERKVKIASVGSVGKWRSNEWNSRD